MIYNQVKTPAILLPPIALDAIHDSDVNHILDLELDRRKLECFVDLANFTGLGEISDILTEAWPKTGTQVYLNHCVTRSVHVVQVIDRLWHQLCRNDHPGPLQEEDAALPQLHY